MLRSQLKSYSGADPIWGFVSLVGSERFTGEAVLGPTPRVHLYAVDGRVYYAERDDDRPVGARLLAAGSITAAQLDQGSVDVGGMPSLARLFQRQPLIDRDAVELTIEAATESLLESVADLAAGEVEVFPLRHHPSGIHHWLRSAGAVPLHAASMSVRTVSAAVVAAPQEAAQIVDESPAPDLAAAGVVSAVDGEIAEVSVADAPIPVRDAATPEPTASATADPAATLPERPEFTSDGASDSAAETDGATPPELAALRWGVDVDGPDEGADNTGGDAETDAETDASGADSPDTADETDDTMSDDTMSDDTMSDDTMSDDTMSDDTMSDDTMSGSGPDRSTAPAGVAELPLVARLAPLPSTDTAHLSGLPDADELPPLGAVTYLPSSLSSSDGHSVPTTDRLADAEVNIFAPTPPAAGDDLPKLAAAPIGVDQLMSDQAASAASAVSGQPSQPNSLAAVEIWEMVDNITAAPPAAPASTPSADESLARGWRKGTKNKSR
jgi:hypothetical protein